MLMSLANLPRRFNAVEFRHREIHQDQIRIRAIRLQHAFSAVGGLDDSIAFRAQPRRQECPIIRIIVDYRMMEGVLAAMLVVLRSNSNLRSDQIVAHIVRIMEI